MAIMDDRNEFADATSIAAAAGIALVGDVIDLGVSHRDIGQGQPVYFVVTIDTEVITAGAAGSVRFDLVTDAQAAIAIDGSATVHVTSGNFVTGNAASNDPKLNAGSIAFCAPIPSEGKVFERYMGVLVITNTTATTAGKINAFLTLDPIGWQPYAEGVN